MKVIVTGSNRGIGLELTRQYLGRGAHVVATARDPGSAAELAALQGAGRLEIMALDVTDAASVAALARAIGDAPVDVLINNAGVYGKHGSLADVDFEDALRTIDTNAIGALRVSAALIPNLVRGQDKKLVSITSGMGSIDDNTSGGAYGYRMSKAALNMAMRSLAADLKGDGVTVVAVNPGWVQTDMGGRGAPTKVEDSAAKIIALIERIGLAESGSFLDYRGHTWKW